MSKIYYIHLEIVAVNGTSFTVRKGENFRVTYGPNSASKSTTFKNALWTFATVETYLLQVLIYI